MSYEDPKINQEEGSEESSQEISLLDFLSEFENLEDADIEKFRRSLDPKKWKIFDAYGEEKKMTLVLIDKVPDAEREKLIDALKKKNGDYMVGAHNLSNLIQELIYLKDKDS